MFKIILFAFLFSSVLMAAHIDISMPDGEPLGSVLVVHGLNLAPDKMNDWRDYFRGQNFAVVSLSLSGHGNGNIKEVTRTIWLHEILDAYSELYKIAPHRPKLLLAHSLGGLLAIDMINSSRPKAFDGMILLAPAIAVKPYTHLIRVFSAWPGLMIPSASPKEYRANSGTSMAAYNALFKSLKSIQNLKREDVNIPTLLFIDKRDELVSFSGVLKLIEENVLSNWKFIEIQKDSEVDYNHLIVSKVSAGNEAWKFMIENALHFIRALLRQQPQ